MELKIGDTVPALASASQQERVVGQQMRVELRVNQVKQLRCSSDRCERESLIGIMPISLRVENNAHQQRALNGKWRSSSISWNGSEECVPNGDNANSMV